MSDMKEKLIDLFAGHNVEEIEANKASFLKQSLGIQDYRKILESEDFKKKYGPLKALRQELDNAIRGAVGHEQVKACLRLLKKANKRKEKNDLKLLSRFIKESLYGKWQKNEKEYYDSGLEMIADWKDFFISYTEWSLIETNNDFKEVLTNVFGKTDFEKNQERNNCVARLIAHYLKANNLTAFYDKDNITCGDNIKKEIFKYCKSAFAFVQLIETAVFREDGEEGSWCFREFKAFNDWNKQKKMDLAQRYYFILTESEVYPANFPGYYEFWKQTILDHHNIQDLSSLDKKQIKEKVREIASKIKDTKNRLLDSYIE